MKIGNIELIIEGVSVDLPKNLRLTKVEKNQIFEDGLTADYTYPITLPVSPVNNRVLGLFHLPESDTDIRVLDGVLNFIGVSYLAKVRFWKASSSGYEVSIKTGHLVSDVMEQPLSSLPLKSYVVDDLQTIEAWDYSWPDRDCCFPLIIWREYFGENPDGDDSNKKFPYYSGLINLPDPYRSGEIAWNPISDGTTAGGVDEGIPVNFSDAVPQVFICHLIEKGFAAAGYHVEGLTGYLTSMFLLCNKGIGRMEDYGLVRAEHDYAQNWHGTPGTVHKLKAEVELTDSDNKYNDATSAYHADKVNSIYELSIELEFECGATYNAVPGTDYFNIYVGNDAPGELVAFHQHQLGGMTVGDKVVIKKEGKGLLNGIASGDLLKIYAEPIYEDVGTGSTLHIQAKVNYIRIEWKNWSWSNRLRMLDFDLANHVPDWTFGEFISKLKDALNLNFYASLDEKVVTVSAPSTGVAVLPFDASDSVSPVPTISREKKSRFIGFKKPKDKSYDEIQLTGILAVDGVYSEERVENVTDVDEVKEVEGTPLPLKKGSDFDDIEFNRYEYLPFTRIEGYNETAGVKGELEDLRLMFHRGKLTPDDIFLFANSTGAHPYYSISFGPIDISFALRINAFDESIPESQIQTLWKANFYPWYQMLLNSKEIEFEWYPDTKELAELPPNEPFRAYGRTIIPIEREIEVVHDHLKVKVKGLMRFNPDP